jgi:hypothetical protein
LTLVGICAYGPKHRKGHWRAALSFDFISEAVLPTQLASIARRVIVKLGKTAVPSEYMSNFTSLLGTKVKEIEHDPAEMRKIVYDAARLALKQQLYAHRPPFKSTDIRQSFSDLEAAIEWVESQSAQRHLEQATTNKHLSEARRVAWRSEPTVSVEPDDLVILPEGSAAAQGQSSYLVQPKAPAPTKFNGAYEVVSGKRRPPLGWLWVSGLVQALQLIVASITGVMIYVTVWPPGTPSTPLAPVLAEATAPKQSAAAMQSASLVESMQAARAEMARAMNEAAKIAPAPFFPRPTSYGIYAISDNQLIDLDRVQTSPFDPRVRSVLKITHPSRTMIDDPRLMFLIFRRDMITGAPDKLPIRIAARIAKIMSFDSNANAVVAPPPTESWLIRDQGYELRVSPLPESQEMVLARPDDPEFSFPPGRYELLLGGEAYDFVITGVVNDPAHCVESVATGRGPVFYECHNQ